MAKVIKEGQYLMVVGDDGERIIDRQTEVNINSSVNNAIEVTVSFFAEPEDIEVEELELKEKVFEEK